MLIAIAGSQGTGKSTVLSKLSDTYNIVSRKTSRSILSDWGVTLDQVNSDLQLAIKFQDEILARKLEDEKQGWEDGHGIWLTERTPIDLLTYATITIGPHNQYSDWLSQYAKLCIDMCDRYCHVVYLQGGLFAIDDDGVRGVNPVYGQLVNAAMDHFYHQYIDSSRLHRCTTADLNERIHIIKTIVNTIPLRSSQ